MIKCLKYFLCGSLSLLYLFSLNPKALKNNVGEPRFNAPISNTSVQELISDFAENQEELFLPVPRSDRMSIRRFLQVRSANQYV